MVNTLHICFRVIPDGSFALGVGKLWKCSFCHTLFDGNKAHLRRDGIPNQQTGMANHV